MRNRSRVQNAAWAPVDLVMNAVSHLPPPVPTPRTATSPSTPAAPDAPTRASSRPSGRKHPLVIGHRGASGYRPEHTVEAYLLAIQQGAHSIEPDLVPTADGHLVARHESEIGRTTDVAEHPEFAHRYTTRVVSDREVSGWFTEDFTLAELKTLATRERLPRLRPANTLWHDAALRIASFDEILALASRHGVGVHAETKHAGRFESAGFDVTGSLAASVKAARAAGMTSKVSVMSFEATHLRKVRSEVDVAIVQLVDRKGRPQDLKHAGDPRKFRDLVTPSGMSEIADYADAVGLHKHLVLPRAEDETVGEPTTLVKRAHKRALDVLVWTVRAENKYLPAQWRRGSTQQAYGELAEEVRLLESTGVDGLLTDHPDLVIGALARQTS